MASLLEPSQEKYVLAYFLFAATIVLAVASMVFSTVRPWASGLVAILAFPANAFIQVASRTRMPGGVTGDLFLLFELLVALLLVVAYLYFVASVLVWVRDALPKSKYASHRRSYR